MGYGNDGTTYEPPPVYRIAALWRIQIPSPMYLSHAWAVNGWCSCSYISSRSPSPQKGVRHRMSWSTPPLAKQRMYPAGTHGLSQTSTNESQRPIATLSSSVVGRLPPSWMSPV